MTTYSSSLEDHEDGEARKLILHFFTKFMSNRTLKKYMQNLVAKSKITQFIIKNSTADISQKIQLKQCNITECIDLLNFVVLMQMTPSYNYEEAILLLFPVYCKIYGGFVYYLK